MYNLICVTGPTACGKTSFAVKLAAELQGEIISADSRQVYKGMDIGTGKDLDEYNIKGKTVPYHLIDIVDAGYKYNIFEYQKDFFAAFGDCRTRGVFPIVCGGSGLYLETVLKKYRLIEVPVNEELRNSLKNRSLSELTEILATYKQLHNTTDVDNIKRAVRAIEIEEYYSINEQKENDLPELHPLLLGLDISREDRRERITSRLKQRLDNGMIEEVKTLLDSGVPSEDLIYYGLEYKYLTLYLTGELTYSEMFDKLNVAIHQFAKRQMTWFRKMEKDGFDIRWLDYRMPDDEKIAFVKNLLAQ
ncbi:MAG: tRNA (adenosine(37)-N6)-dimethylallyltransferase MiaA [Culturomica sp.]|jgi:tRNA dimethylallyltransferase|nr:tRNA (adenosine(37)-N6)-dimethylallyltransferase MiaA [Culturomica sp.]